MSNNIQPNDSSLLGVATRVSAAEKAAMALQATSAVLRATIHVTRAATGRVETYELIGTPVQPSTQQQE